MKKIKSELLRIQKGLNPAFFSGILSQVGDKRLSMKINHVKKVDSGGLSQEIVVKYAGKHKGYLVTLSIVWGRPGHTIVGKQEIYTYVIPSIQEVIEHAVVEFEKTIMNASDAYLEMPIEEALEAQAQKELLEEQSESLEA